MASTTAPNVTSRSSAETASPITSDASTQVDVEKAATGEKVSDKSLSDPVTTPATPYEAGGKAGDAIYLEWDASDPRHPFNWSPSKRWSATLLAFLFNSSTAMNATGYTTAQDSGSSDLNTTPLIWLTGSTAYLVPVAITPLILAPLSEIYGRKRIYLVALFIYTMMFIPQALAPNMAGVIASRIVQGMSGSVGNTMVAGSVADIFPKDRRAVPMSAFVLTVFMSQAVGSMASAWTVASIGWRWIFWWQGAIALGSFFLLLCFLPESRACVLLSRRARELSKVTGKPHRTREDDERDNFFVTVGRNVSRPLILFTTEPIVTFLALWIGFLWGVVFLSLNGVSDTFEVYGWSSPQKQTVLLTIGVGGLIGFGTNLHQAWLYDRAQKRHGGRAPPEARLYWSMPGAVFTAAGLLWYGWGGQAHVHPAVPIIGLVLFSWGTYIIYLATLNYIADAYETYASSGVACQALLRNILAGTFGLFAHAMYRNLTPPYASTVLGCIAAALGTAPFVLFFFGKSLRRRSPIYQRLRREEELKGTIH